MSGEVIDMGPSSGDVEEIFNQLVSDLEHQIELCKKNATTFQKLGDLPSAKHYAQLFQNQSKDLANLKGLVNDTSIFLLRSGFCLGNPLCDNIMQYL